MRNTTDLPKALSAAAFPQLESFFGGYLAEDFHAEYGSPEGALRAWRLNATAKESQQFDREVEKLMDAASKLPFDTIAAFVRRDLCSAWRPSDRFRLQQLLTTAPRRAPR